jgi:D-alanyl-D-alanine carboxypeptidase (penicillin-binding protein 5/6)
MKTSFFPAQAVRTTLSIVAGVLGWALLSSLSPAAVLASHATPSAAVLPATAPSAELPSLNFFRRHQAQAQSILLKDLSSGRTLYEVRANRRVAPASLTKIMSALVILEYGQLRDQVTVSRKAASARKIHLRLHAGHVFRLEDLLKAMLITSANDACLAAVEHVGGSEEMFVAMMNNKARRMGLLDTHYSNACGFDSPTHYTTAADLATLSEIAMQDHTFRSLVRKEVDMIFPINANRSYWLRNTNRLLGRIPGIEGIKTGFTSQAGRCLVAKASQNGKEVLLVLLHANRRWDTASSLLRQGIQSLP